MKKFVAFAVATLITAGASIAMAQNCPTCSGNAAPVFGSAQPVYAAPAAPVYDQSFSQPVYSQPVYDQSFSQPAYAAPAAPVYSQPIASVGTPVYGGGSSCGCDTGCGCGSTGGEVVYGGAIGGEATFTGGDFNSYSNNQTLNVGSVINGETVVSVGDTVIVGTTDPGEGSGDGNSIDGNVEPSPDGGEVVSPPGEDKPSPEAMEGDA